MTAMARMWAGPEPWEAQAAFKRARAAGMSAVRSLVVAHIASFRDGWIFRKRLAAWVGCSVRTAQRAITQAKELGLLGVQCARPDERPHGLPPDKEAPWGWTHRWTIGRGTAGEALKRAIDTARKLIQVRRAMRPVPPEPCATTAKPCSPRSPHEGRRWTAEELEAELARALEEHPPPPRAKPPP